MTKSGYTAPFSAALIGSAATIGPIIPPSIIMVIYASIANVSIGRMFLGGVLPGVVMGVCLMGLTALTARQGKLPRGVQASAGEVARATGRASLVLLTPLIVIVGIVGGAFTATESAAIACAYALLLGLGIYRTVRLADLKMVFQRAVWTSGRVMLVVALASGFSWILARGGVPSQLAHLPFFSGSAKPWMILLALNVLLLILGCLMESIAILLIMTPMILPIAIHAGIDPIHLGVVMSVNLSIGLVTPPFGTAMFVMCAIGRCSITDFSREVWPFLGALLLALIVTTYVPGIVLFLPNLIMGAK
jgi:tripartite ATP-independent transporter DctM subunit